jgi:dihydrofolate synthase/folylpolyglutamate synthase
VIPGVTFGDSPAGDGRYTWWETVRPEERFETATPGRFQVVNAATALTAIRAMSEYSRLVSPDTIRAGLRAARLQGRFELVQTEPTVILDGAHNPQKVAALARELRAWRVRNPESRVVVLFGVLESKDHTPMLAQISTVADEIVTTSPRVLAKVGATAGVIAAAARRGFSGAVTAVDDPIAALEVALNAARPLDLVVATGSLYLVGNIRGRWYPDDEIVIQRTPWPTR